MADLTDIQSAETIKIAGADPSTGVETNYADVDSSGNLKTTNNNASGAAAVNIQDGGNSLTIDSTQLPASLGQKTMANSFAVVVASDQTTLPISAASLPLPSGASTEATLAKLPLAQNSTTSGQFGPLAQGAVTTSAPSYTNLNTSPISLTLAGALRVDNSAVTQPVSGTITANQGSPNTAANAWFEKITDGTDTAKITANSDLSVSDGLRSGGVYGALTLTTGGTAYEAKVGVSRLTNRKSLTITALDDMYWGYDSSVTVSTGTPLYKNQQIIFAVDPDSTFQIWVVASTNSKTARITESP